MSSSVGGASSGLCAASVPAARARSIEYWSAKHTQHPPCDRLGEFIELRCEGSLSTHMVAKRDFQNGDIILRESALIRIPDAPASQKRRLDQRYGQRSAFLFPAVSLDWEKVGADVKEAILALFWCHPILESSSSMLRESYQACCDLLVWDAALGRSWTADDLIRYLHIVDLNIHKDDEEEANAAFGGLFVLGSKFSHSCAPNCTWSFSKEGYLQYHAVRPIKPGDVLTFSYIGNGMNMVTSTISRRRRLGALWFVCQCSRCEQPDLSRQLRCPKCAAPKCIPADEKLSKDAMEWSCEKPLDIMVPEVKLWSCMACGGTFRSEEMPLAMEEKLSEAVPQIMQGNIQDADEDAGTVLDMRRVAGQKLGQGHWTWMLATFAWLQKCLMIVTSHTVVDFSERDAREASIAVAKWFEQFAPENTEQRMSAVSLTLKLMQSLGGSCEAWGYNAGNPLGDGLPMSFLCERLGMSKATLDESGFQERDARFAGKIPASVEGKAASRRYKGIWK